MSLTSQVSSLATRIATELKTVHARIGNVGALTTGDKSSLVGAVNELKAVADALTIDEVTDATATGQALVRAGDPAAARTTLAVYSTGETDSAIATANAALVDSAPAALDTLKELADALGDDPNFATTVTTALGNRVRVDTASQGLTGTQKQNARTNIDVYSTVEIGDPNTDFVAVFTAAL